MHLEGPPLARQVAAHQDLEERGARAMVALADVGQDTLLQEALQGRPHAGVAPMALPERVVLKGGHRVHSVELGLPIQTLFHARHDLLHLLPSREALDKIEVAGALTAELRYRAELLHALPFADRATPRVRKRASLGRLPPRVPAARPDIRSRSEHRRRSGDAVACNGPASAASPIPAVGPVSVTRHCSEDERSSDDGSAGGGD
mmetsp:Transcript_8212/g.20992  ORF Transcript_8212/g.20992 Transcript_8212/m.20992 type:complete len:204 (+) Transcript_8212:564-1175(+)